MLEFLFVLWYIYVTVVFISEVVMTFITGFLGIILKIFEAFQTILPKSD